MYSKVFSQIFDSSLAEDYITRHVFMDLLVLADPLGQVDMTAEAIARRTNIPLNVIHVSLVNLCKPDPRSRTSTHEGRRLIPLDDHRDWGWQIVNFQQYHKLKNSAGKRDYMRAYMARRREEERKDVSSSKPCKPQLANVTHEGRKTKDEEKKDPLLNFPSLVNFIPVLKEYILSAHPNTHAFDKDNPKEAEVLSQLVRLDNFSEGEIIDTLTWLFTVDTKDTEFWRVQVGGIVPLRKPCRNGLTKFASIYECRKRYSHKVMPEQTELDPEFIAEMEYDVHLEGGKANISPEEIERIRNKRAAANV